MIKYSTNDWKVVRAIGEENTDPLINTLSFLTSRCLFLISSLLLSVMLLSGIIHVEFRKKSVLKLMIDTQNFAHLLLHCHTINASLPLIGPLSFSYKKAWNLVWIVSLICCMWRRWRVCVCVCVAFKWGENKIYQPSHSQAVRLSFHI